MWKTFKSLRSETSDGYVNIRNGQNIEFLANQLCAVFCIESDFSSQMVRKFTITFYEKTCFFWDPLDVPLSVEHIFEDPQKSSMIFYRKDLTAKIMLRTHMLFLKLPKSPDAHTHGRTSIFRRFPHNSPKGAISLFCARRGGGTSRRF